MLCEPMPRNKSWQWLLYLWACIDYWRTVSLEPNRVILPHNVIFAVIRREFTNFDSFSQSDSSSSSSSSRCKFMISFSCENGNVTTADVIESSHLMREQFRSGWIPNISSLHIVTLRMPFNEPGSGSKLFRQLLISGKTKSSYALFTSPPWRQD